jgi:hypothetical protein
MGKGFSTQSPARWLAGLALIGAMWWVAFEQGERIPGLTYVNLAMHQAGHMFTYSASELTTAMAASIAQVAIPLLIALYFFFLRSDWVGAGVSLVWAATSAAEVSLFVADARAQKLELLGDDKHDWAFILGPGGYDAMHRSAELAIQIRDIASVAVIVGFALCVAALVRGSRRSSPQPDPMVSSSRASAASRF